MQRSPAVAAVVATLAHAALVAWVAYRAIDRTSPPVAAHTQPIEPVTAPTGVLELQVIALDVSSGDLRSGQLDGVREPPRRPAFAATGATSGNPGIARAGEPVIHPGEERGAGGLSPLAMRGRRHVLGLTEETLARLAPPRSGPPAEPVPITGRLAPSGGGEHRVNDAVVKMRVHTDGSVDLTRVPDFSIKWRGLAALPSFDKLRRDLGATITSWYADPDAGKRVGRKGDISPVVAAVPGACDSWGDAWCASNGNDVPPVGEGGPSMPIASGRADVTGYLARKLVGDPYASRKLKLLDTTRPERVAIGTVHRAERLARAVELVRDQLEAMWRSTPDAAARRLAAFTLWDDCAEAGDADTALAGAGQRARDFILAWIAAKFPPGSTDAFTPDEVARLDAKRTSRQHFAPYR